MQLVTFKLGALLAAAGLAWAPGRCGAQVAFPHEPSLDAAGNYTHEADVSVQVIFVSSSGVLLECSQPASDAHPASVWRERYTVHDGRLTLASIITRQDVPLQPAHEEWSETTISHSNVDPLAKPQPPDIEAATRSISTAIGPVTIDPRWGGFGAYLGKMTASIQAEWEHVRIASKIYSKPGSAVTVKFMLNAKGVVTRVVDIDTLPNVSDAAARACVLAIVDPSPYGPWTDEMVASLGPEQQMALSFVYP
jgi:hypothetical protein